VRTRAKQLTLACATVLLLLLLAEAATRIALPHQSLAVLTGREAGPNPMGKLQCADAYSAYRPRPMRSSERNGRRKTSNAAGFASTPAIAPTRPDEVTRIAFLGGSTTFSTVSDDRSWPWLVIEALRERFPEREFDFINGGNLGWTTFESYGLLWSRIRFYRPDIVVVTHAWNDLKLFHKNKVDEVHTRLRGANGCWDFANLPEPVEWYEPFFLDPLIGRSQFLTDLRIRLSSRKNEVERRGTAHVDSVHLALANRYDPRGLQIYRENLRLMESTTAMWGGVLFAVKQPTLIVEGSAASAKISYELTGFTHDTIAALFQEVYTVLDVELPGRTIDAASVMNGVAENFRDHVHMKKVGHARLADIVSARLAEHLASEGQR
jgi:lysophospholipase L1-like esterase